MRTLLLVAALFGVAAPSRGAAPPPGAASDPAPVHTVATTAALQSAEPDSSTLRDRAEDAQARFERRRRRAMPRTRFPSSGGSCDEVVGRFCLRFGGGEDWTPEPASPEVLQARDDLLDTLTDIGRRIPGDSWVKSQRVHYLGEEGRWDEALEVVGSCGAPDTEWRCHALRGYVLHRSDRYEEALAAFDTALEAMDGDRRERWRDPEVILDRSARGVWTDADEEREETLRRRLWTLSDPLYLAPGNDRLTEHLARHTSSWIRDDARNPYGMSWGWDLAELVVRYGSEMGWERERPRVMSTRSASVVGHHHPESRQYVPPGAVFGDPLAFEADEWSLEEERPRTSYAPPYAPEMEGESFQVALFRRGEEMVVVAGYRLPPDTASSGRLRDGGGEEPGPAATGDDFRPSGPTRAGLFLLDPDSAGRHRVHEAGADSGGLSLRAPTGRYLASVEVWSPERARAARTRTGLRQQSLPPDVAALSDLLVLNPGPDLPEDLEAAVPRARARLRGCPGETLAVGWEVYGLGLRRESVGFRLRLERTERGFLERAGEWLGLADRSSPVALEWTEPGPDRFRPFFRAVDLTLPSDLEAGTYAVRLEARLPGRSPLQVERTLRIDEPGVCQRPF